MGELPEISISALDPVVTALDYGQLGIAVVTISYGHETARSSGWWALDDKYTLTDDPIYLELKKTVESNGGNISTVSITFDVPSEDELMTKLLSSPNKRLKNVLAMCSRTAPLTCTSRVTTMLH